MRSFILSLACLAPALSAAQPTPPRTVVHADTLHGVVIEDPYRWMEDDADPEAAAWVSAQEAHARATLDALPGRAALEARIGELLATGSGILGIAETPRDLLLVREGPAGLLLTARTREREGWSADERIVFDAAAFAPDEPPAFRAYVPSPDGRHVLIGRTRRGDAEPEVLVVETATGRVLPDHVRGLLLTSGGSIRPTWHPDGASFFYPKADATEDPAERLFRGRFFSHRIGAEPAEDVPVFGFGLSDAVLMAPADTPNRMVAGERWLVGSVWVAAEFAAALYAAPVADLDGAATPWRRIASTEDGIEIPVLVGDTAFAVSSRDAPRGRLVRLDLADPAARWEVALPERSGVMTAVRAASDALYLTERVGGAMRLLRLPYGATEAEVVPLPVEGTVHLLARHDAPGVLVTVESWLVPPRTYRYDPATGAVTDAGIEPPTEAAFGNVVAERVEARAPDGTAIPVSVVRLLDRPRDGTAPLLLEAYGTFGVAVDPEFLPQLLAWVERGGVYAFAHVRGGGELGRGWHEAAQGARKPVSSADLVAVAEHLIAQGYTAPGRIGLYGVSAGGLLGANAVADRPDLFGAAIHDVSPFDVVGMARNPSGARNLAEFGWDDTAAGVRAALAVSPYHRLRPGEAYPAVLVHSGTEDYNFGLAIGSKYVARLQAATTSGRPVLWDVSREGGHDAYLYGGPAAFADALAFLFWQLGDPPSR